MNEADRFITMIDGLRSWQVLPTESLGLLSERLSSMPPLFLIAIIVVSGFFGVGVQGFTMMRAASRVALPIHKTAGIRPPGTEEQKTIAWRAISAFGLYAGLVLIANLAAEGLRIQVFETSSGEVGVFSAFGVLFVVIGSRLMTAFLLLAVALSAVLLFMPPPRDKPQNELQRDAAAESADRFSSLAEEHDALKEEWGRWHTDLDRIINYSAIHDVRHEAFAVEIVEASEDANSVREQSARNPSSQTAADRFQKAIDRFSAALDEGVHQAELLGTNDIDPVLRRVVLRAQSLLKVVRHTSTTRFEKENAARALYSALRPIVGHSDGRAEMPELETAIQRELEATPHTS